MHLDLKLKIYRAIEGVINKQAEKESLWEWMIHPDLVGQMTDAAELVFDSAQQAVKYSEENK